MSIISQETFEKFTEKEKKGIRIDYQDLLSDNGRWIDSLTIEERNGAITQLEWIFDKDNLQPKPKIRTWKDVKEEYMLRADTETSYIIDIDKKLYSEKLVLKALATLQIAKLIELGYGGMITDEEWRDENTEKWSVLNHNFGDFDIVNVTIRFGWKSFISFHTKQQAQEFISYSENVELIKQYYMI